MDATIITLLTDLTGWSVTVPLSAVAIVGLLRRPLSGLIDRATRFSAATSGVTVEASARAERNQQIEASRDDKQPALPAPLEAAGASAPKVPDPNPVYNAFDASLIAELYVAFKDDDDVKLAWAVRLRSQAVVERMHETHYRLIFTAQIWALKRLNEIVYSSMSQARSAYDFASQQNPDFYKLVNFENWIGFLKNTGYIEIGIEEDPVIQLTPLGKDFLGWMVAKGVSESKPL